MTIEYYEDDAMVPDYTIHTLIHDTLEAKLQAGYSGLGYHNYNGEGVISSSERVELIRNQSNARQTGQLLSRHLATLSPSKTVQFLRWLFIDWKLANIAVVLHYLGLAGHIEATIFSSLTWDWEERHVAELLYLFYIHGVKPSVSGFTRMKECLGLMDPVMASRAVTWLKLYLQRYRVAK